MKKMLVVGSLSYGRPFQHKYEYMNGKILPELPHKLKETPDLIVFTGGEDICPSMYGEENIASYGCNSHRDHYEKLWFMYAKSYKIPMVGICRGMQLFTVMQGGSLLQHIDGHGGKSHYIHTIDDTEVPVNSLHHQVCIPYSPKEGKYVGELLAWSHAGSNWEGSDHTEKVFQDMGCVPEAIWYPEIKALGVQFHPEMMVKDSPGYIYFQEIFNKYLG